MGSSSFVNLLDLTKKEIEVLGDALVQCSIFVITNMTLRIQPQWFISDAIHNYVSHTFSKDTELGILYSVI